MSPKWPTLGHYWGGSLTSPMSVTAFKTYSTQRSPGALKQSCVPLPCWVPVRVLTRALLGPVNDPVTTEFTKAISQWANANSKYFFLSCSSQCCFYFFHFLVIFIAILSICNKILASCFKHAFVSFFTFISFALVFYFFHFYRSILLYVKVQSCKLYNNKYMIASTKITNTDIFAFIALLVFKLLSHNVLFISKDNINC